jgi:tRNA-2-methylthio-N6-dimethylallyladenosine synthase
MTKKYNMVTFGCQMNEYDSNLIAQMLDDRGCSSVDNAEDADFVIVNTCSVREKAEDTAFSKLAQLQALKKHKPDMKLAVIGCMAKNKGEGIPEISNGVDIVLGPDSYKHIDDLLFAEPIGTGAKKRLERDVKVITEFDDVENYVGKSAKITNSISSFITIQRGCNKRCTYCIVPFVRGNEKYRPAEDILRECKEAVDQGVTELTLLGQTVNSYRDGGDTFASLLHKVSEINGLKRIRFTSPHPKHFTDDLIWVMGNRPNICRHTHFPLQSGSDRILAKMRRQYDMEKYYEISEKLRKIDPLFSLTTDIIVGFVGEEREDFEATLEAVKKIRFDAAFMFAYSPREGTKAFDEVETLDEKNKLSWLQELIEVQNKITFEINQGMIGRTEELLIEGPSHRDENEFVGKTECFKKVIVPRGNLKIGDYATAHINDIRGWTLRGELV